MTWKNQQASASTPLPENMACILEVWVLWIELAGEEAWQVTTTIHYLIQEMHFYKWTNGFHLLSPPLTDWVQGFKY